MESKRRAHLEAKEAAGVLERQLLEGSLLKDAKGAPTDKLDKLPVLRGSDEGVGSEARAVETDARVEGSGSVTTKLANAKEITERALARVQTATAYLELQRFESDLTDVRSTFRSLPPLDAEAELRKRFTKVDIQSPGSFSSNLAHIQNIISVAGREVYY
jgi:hypothetical protein